jgi:hypothetical protein
MLSIPQFDGESSDDEEEEDSNSLSFKGPLLCEGQPVSYAKEAEVAELDAVGAGLPAACDGYALEEESGTDRTGTDTLSLQGSALSSSRELRSGRLPLVPSIKVVIPSFIPPVNVGRHNVLSAAEHNAISAPPAPS